MPAIKGKAPLLGRFFRMLFVIFPRVVVKDLRDGREDAVFMLDDVELAPELLFLKGEGEHLFKLHIIARGGEGDQSDAQPLAHHLLHALARADLDGRAQLRDVNAHTL